MDLRVMGSSFRPGSVRGHDGGLNRDVGGGGRLEAFEDDLAPGGSALKRGHAPASGWPR